MSRLKVVTTAWFRADTATCTPPRDGAREAAAPH